MTYKTFIPKQIYLLVALAIVLSLARIVLFDSISLLYLLWNIFLACLPFVASSIILHFQNKKKLTRFFFILGTIIWLLLLPNAPYIITDLVHIGSGHASQVFYNTILFFTCALAGLVLGLYSLAHMDSVFRARYGTRIASMLMIASMLLTSFGVCFGRFFRFNSWDIVVSGRTFLQDVGSIFWYPHLYVHVYITALSLFFLLFMTYGAYSYDART